MTEIRINPDELDRAQVQLQDIASRLSELLKELTKLGITAPGYDGQFKAKIIPLTFASGSRIAKISQEMSVSEQKLKKISDRFRRVDSDTRSSSKFNLNEILPDWIKPFIIGSARSNLVYLISLASISGLGALWTGVDPTIKYAQMTVNNIKNYFINEDVSEEQSLHGIAKTFRKLKDSPAGQELINLAIASGILFVIYDKNGAIIESVGDPNGSRIVPVSWGGMEGAYGYYSPSEGKIVLNESYRGTISLYEETLVHEMSHAIDFNEQDVNQFFPKSNEILVDDRGSDQPLTPNEIEGIQSEFEAAFEFYVDSEVKAHDIGYEHGKGFNEQWYGHNLNRLDGMNVHTEKNFILETRSYHEQYETWVENTLNRYFPDGPKYAAKVSLSNDGKVKVSIKTTKQE